jgi:Arc/MetJ family transcription regulator
MMPGMRTTIRIDDDLLRELEQRAALEGVSLEALVNEILRRGLRAPVSGSSSAFAQATFEMGPARVAVTKALDIVDLLEVEEASRKSSHYPQNKP